MPILQRIPPLHGPRQIKQSLLDVRSKEAEAHDPSDAGAGDVAQTGELGHTLDLVSLEPALEGNGEDHQARQTRDVARFDRRLRLGDAALDERLFAAFLAAEMNVSEKLRFFSCLSYSSISGSSGDSAPLTRSARVRMRSTTEA